MNVPQNDKSGVFQSLEAVRDAFECPLAVVAFKLMEDLNLEDGTSESVCVSVCFDVNSNEYSYFRHRTYGTGGDWINERELTLGSFL